VPFDQVGQGALIEALRQWLDAMPVPQSSAPSGVRQHLFYDKPGADTSGNAKLHDIRPHLNQRVTKFLSQLGMEL
jgi:hypothetical protein